MPAGPGLDYAECEAPPRPCVAVCACSARATRRVRWVTVLPRQHDAGEGAADGSGEMGFSFGRVVVATAVRGWRLSEERGASEHALDKEVSPPRPIPWPPARPLTRRWGVLCRVTSRPLSTPLPASLSAIPHQKHPTLCDAAFPLSGGGRANSSTKSSTNP